MSYEHAQRAMEQAEDQLHDQLAAGLISLRDFNDEMRAMAREYRDMAEEAAQDAYDCERDRW